MRFALTELSSAEHALRGEVRDFLALELPRGSFTPGLGMTSPKDPEFSRKLGARGWLGMTIPRAYGGHDRSAVERLVVTEELLRWGAPVAHHWVADRQSAPVIARFGSEELKRRFLPPICRGELSFSIGMSEPDSGSDLASLTTRATRDGDGWVLNGRKVWTTLAHVNDWIIVLCRTTPLEDSGDQRQGLSQMLVDLRSPGVTATPIPFIDGSAEFTEVVLDDAFVPDELVLGEIGAGWSQNTSELAYERGGPDRWLSTYLVVEELLRAQEDDPGAAPGAVLDLLGTAISNYRVLHQLTLSVARAVDRGDAPVVEASLLKEMGTRFEQDVLNSVLALVGNEPRLPPSSRFEQLLVAATVTAPAFTIRGGTLEILRSVAAKGLRPGALGPTASERSTEDDRLLEDTVERLLAKSCSVEVIEQAEAERWCATVWDPLAESGFPWISIDEAAGGSGGSLSDALAVVRVVGRYAAPVPLAETALLGAWLEASAGFNLTRGPLTVVTDGHALELVEGRVLGRAVVPWAEAADSILALVDTADATMIVGVRPEQLMITPRANMAGEPRDDVVFDVALDSVRSALAPDGVDAHALSLRGCLSRAVLSAGALEAIRELTIEYTNERRQFGRPIATFQAVQQHLVSVVQCSARASIAVDAAVRVFTSKEDPTFAISTARVIVDAAEVEATRAAHQAHGAIGVAREYPLHQFTRRLWSWRHEYGSGSTWRRSLGAEVATGGADQLFPSITR